LAKNKKKNHLLIRCRTYAQACWTLLTNSYASGYLNGTIYQGKLKSACVPGLNCYSCPGAWGSCPMGALQNALSGRVQGFPFYVFGTLLTIGALLGRIVCGWLCPFGLVQDLVFKLPPRKKVRALPGESYLRKLRYVVLIVMGILLPLFAKTEFGVGMPWFCKWVCPSGTLLGGLPLIALNAELRSVLGLLFTWKVALLVLILAGSIFVYRPFCRYLCPLGAIYGVMNPISLVRMRVSKSRCTQCGACQKACALDIPVYKTPNSTDCIRCGKCITVCPNNALKLSASLTGKRKRRAAEA